MDVNGHCLYSTADGRRYPGAFDWEGMNGANAIGGWNRQMESATPADDAPRADKQGDRIGMLLDLDQGSMSVYKNGVKMGVMQPNGQDYGLTGPLCWAATVCYAGDSVRIESGPAPASPTQKELGAEREWQDYAQC